MSKETLVKEIEKTRSALKLLGAIAMVFIGVGIISFGVRGLIENKVFIRTPKQLIRAEVADSAEERRKGLSGREELDDNRALLFVFEASDYQAIWMKDMKFAIDIVWLDKDKKIVTIGKNIEPSSYPETFESSEPALYVIELNDGRASELGLEVGQTLSW